MKEIHTPQVDVRYWLAITLASVFGTNMGDLYAHESGLGIVKGLALLTLLAALAFIAERYGKSYNEIYYWVVIILIRTGATNIADYLAFRVRVPELPLTLSLTALLALFAWASLYTSRERPAATSGSLPKTKAPYWLAMLTAGVFGTVVGDICEHTFGEGLAAIGLSVLLSIVLLGGYRHAARFIALYWTMIAVARTTGTVIGDWFAEEKTLKIGLPLSTLLSGIAFIAVLTLWRSRRKANLLLDSKGAFSV